MKKDSKFTQTRLGYIPYDWEIKKLEEIASITMGQSPKSKYYNENYDGFPLIQGNADCENRYTKPRLYTSQITKTCNIGDIIMTVRAPVGYVSKSLHHACIGRGVCSIKAKENQEYLYYYLMNYENKWKRISQGSTFESINSNDIKKLDVILPPSIEQSKIASILSTWDKAIELKEKLIEKKQEQKKGLMQKLLTGELRLPGFHEEWKKRKIGELITESKVIAEEPDLNKRITVRLNLKGVQKREVTAVEKENATTQYVRRAGQFIYGKQNLHKGAIGIVPGELDGFQSSSDIPSFDFKSDVDGRWFYYYFSRESFYSYLEVISTGTGSKRVNPKDLFMVKINVPPIDEQRQISTILSCQDQEIKLLEKELKDLKEQKKGLMQSLLTGKVRVKV